MNEFKDDMFDEKNIEKALKKGRRKSILMIVGVSIVAFIVLNIINVVVYSYFSDQAFEEWDAYVRLSTPNAYISETIDSRGILGGETQYKISKDMKFKSVVIEQNQYQFGLIPSLSISREIGGKIGTTGEDWQFNYKENGWRNMLFFHPDIDYKEYKNDSELIEQIQGDKVYEVALSFDKAYKTDELASFEIPKLSWLWVNTYTSDQIDKNKKEAKENSWSSTFIREWEALGFSVRSSSLTSSELNYGYDEFLNLLQTSFAEEHKQAYETIKDIEKDNLEILGIVVYGTKDEISSFMDKPFIKAISLGGTIDNY